MCAWDQMATLSPAPRALPFLVKSEILQRIFEYIMLLFYLNYMNILIIIKVIRV